LLSIESLLIARVVGALMWLTFFVFHLTLAVIALFALWYFQVQPQQLVKSFVAIDASPLVKVVLFLLGTGLGMLLLRFYVKMWRRLFLTATNHYFFEVIDALSEALQQRAPL
jgi:hypothetical protein